MRRPPVFLLARPASPATRAAQWNTNGVSTVLYPARIDLPTRRAAKALESMCARIARARAWASGY
eukprot:6261131-Lingulodinium_polyedra.AAC.1